MNPEGTDAEADALAGELTTMVEDWEEKLAALRASGESDPALEKELEDGIAEARASLAALGADAVAGDVDGAGPGEAAQPSEEAAQASVEAAQPSEEAAQPSEEAAQPSEEAAQPSDEAAQPSEEAVQPSVEAAQPAGRAGEQPAPGGRGEGPAGPPASGRGPPPRLAEKLRAHPRNIFTKQQPDFKALASRHKQFAAHVRFKKGRPWVDFTCAESTRALSQVLLLDYLKVRWDLPDGHLIPTVPNRANYIYWLQDLLALAAPDGQIVGLDVGCGASLIYPLLGASICGWRMVGTDVTDEAYDWALQLIAANPPLQGLLEVRKVRNHFKEEEEGTSGADLPGILTAGVGEGESFAFCMCNPPFFEDMDEANANPSTDCEGTETEMVCPGGEAAFVGRMVEDSMVLRDSVFWYTTMVGKKETLKKLRFALRPLRPTALRTTEFVQGRTHRWAVAWSFSPRARAAATAQLRAKDDFGGAAPVVILHRVSFPARFPAGALALLKRLAAQFGADGWTAEVNAATFTIKGSIPPPGPEEVDPEDRDMPPPPCKRQKHSSGATGTLDASGGTSLQVQVMQEGRGRFMVTASIPHTAPNAVARVFTRTLRAAERDLS